MHTHTHIHFCCHLSIIYIRCECCDITAWNFDLCALKPSTLLMLSSLLLLSRFLLSRSHSLCLVLSLVFSPVSPSGLFLANLLYCPLSLSLSPTILPRSFFLLSPSSTSLSSSFFYFLFYCIISCNPSPSLPPSLSLLLLQIICEGWNVIVLCNVWHWPNKGDFDK